MPLFTGDYNSFHVAYQDVSTNFKVGTADTATVTLISAKSANHTLNIQRIFISVTTFSNHSLTFQDTANTPVVIGVVTIPATQPTAAGWQIYEIDFGPHGYPLTQGKNLQMVISAAGIGAVGVIDAYQELTGIPAAGSTN